jgi:meiotically up-regulated gene 157 (Mug157) protein
MVIPKYFNASVFECKYELNNLAAFLEVSTKYYSATSDPAFFSQFQGTDTIRTILNVVNGLMICTYLANGKVNPLPYTFIRQTTSGAETMSNTDRGNPVQSGTGPFRSFSGPSDDAINFQLSVPANMTFSRYLTSCAGTMQPLNPALAAEMGTLASSLHTAIEALVL